MVQINQKINDLEFEAFQGEEINKMKLSDFGDKWLVVIFYPGDFTFICPTELEETAHYYDEFKKLGAEVISVSTDSVHVHKAWHDTSPAISKIKFPMAADQTGKISREFGVYIEEGEDAGRALRGTFIINPQGLVKAIEIHDNSIGRSAKELLRKFQAAKFVQDHPGLVCPAGWEPGRGTLKPGLDLVGKI